MASLHWEMDHPVRHKYWARPVCRPVVTMLPPAALVLTLATLATIGPMVTAHKFHRGQCPQLTPMGDFDWDQV